MAVILLFTMWQRLGATPAPVASGIDWYGGDVDHAFESARRSKKLVLLYWGAKWCPPCQQLKSFVFTRKDFIEKSNQFVAVHLDGDEPGAQRWGERFHVSGYPTVVILRPDQVEVTRLSGGTDLSLYADLLDTAVSDVTPIKSILTTLRSQPASLSASDCRRLAFYPWDDGNVLAADPKTLAADLDSAGHHCATSSRVERARLTIASAALSATPETTVEVLALAHDDALASHLGDALETLDDPFFANVRALGAPNAAQFLADWRRIMDELANDPAVVDADQMDALAAQLTVVNQFAADKKVPANEATAARARVAAALAKHVDPYVRAGIVNSASHVYAALGDEDGMYRMLVGEVRTAKAPFYYMVDLGELEEKRGHRSTALEWYQRAYRQSTGTATRFQWGYDYLTALLRLGPEDHERIRAVGIEVIAELSGPDRIHARTRVRLEKLDVALRQWNTAHGHDGDIGALRAQMRGICTKLPKNDSGHESCMEFLSDHRLTSQRMP
jgi:thiol-disulfide isomerase/thioredoxin